MGYYFFVYNYIRIISDNKIEVKGCYMLYLVFLNVDYD